MITIGINIVRMTDFRWQRPISTRVIMGDRSHFGRMGVPFRLYRFTRGDWVQMTGRTLIFLLHYRIIRPPDTDAGLWHALVHNSSFARTLIPAEERDLIMFGGNVHYLTV